MRLESKEILTWARKGRWVPVGEMGSGRGREDSSEVAAEEGRSTEPRSVGGCH